MPSRRPPSQRDPAYALHRLPGTVAQAAPGLKVKNAAPVKTATPSRKVAAAPGGPVGAAIAEGAFPSSLSGVGNYATAISIVDSSGDPGVSIISGDQLRFQPGTYVVTRNTRFAALSGSSSTLHLCYMLAALIPLGSAMTFGTNPAVVASSHTEVLGGTTTDGMRVDFLASAGTPTYELEADVMQLFILRLA